MDSIKKKVNAQTQQFILTAHELGAEIGEVTESARLWGRMYKDVGVVQELVRQSTMLSTVDLVSLEDATKSMESVLAQYGVQLKNTVDAQLYGNRILDSWSKVAHETMAPARDLGAAFERTGKIAAETGVSFDFMNGLVSAGIRNTALSGENLGNMWKTVLGTIRTGKAVDEIEKLGVQTKEVVNGAEQWKKAEDILLELSVKVIDKNYDLTKSYADISRGVYQYAKLAASLNAGDILLGTAASISSSGETLKYLEVQMDTIQRKSSQVKTSFLEIFNTAGNDGLRTNLKDILDIFDQLLIGITKIPPGLIEFGAAFTGVTAVAGLAKQPVLNLIKAVGVLREVRVVSAAAVGVETAAVAANTASNELNAVSNTQKTVAMGASTIATEAQTVATGAATVATEGLAAAEATATVTMAAMTGGLTLIAALFVGVALSAGKAEKEQRDYVQSVKDEISINNQRISQYQRQAEFLPKAAKTYEAYNKLLKDGTLTAKQRADVNKQLAETEKAIEQTVQSKDGLDNLKATVNSHYDYQKALQNEIDLIQKKASAQREANKEEIKGLQTKNDKEITAKYDQILNKEKQIADYKNSHKYQGEGVQLKNLQNQLAQLNSEYAVLKKGQQDYNDQLEQLDSEQMDQLAAKADQLAQNTDDAAEATQKLFDSMDEYADDIKTLNQTIYKLNAGQSLNGEEVYDLIKKYPELAGHVKKTTDGWKLELKAIQNLREDKIKLANADMQTEKNKSINALNESLKRLRIYGLEIEAIQNAQDAQKALNKLQNTDLSKGTALYELIKGKTTSTKLGSTLFNYWDTTREGAGKEATGLLQSFLNENNKQVQLMQDMMDSMSDPNFGVSSDSNKQKAANETYSETNEILSETQKRLRDIQAELDKLNNKRAKIKRGSEEYRKSLQDEIKLLKEQKSLYEDGIKHPEKLVSTKVTTTTKGKETSSSVSNTPPSSSITNLISNAQSLQGKFTYKQISGEFKGSYDQFLNRAISDCSQFVQEMFKQFAATKLPRTAAEQYKKGTKVDKADLQPGDLVFFNTNGKTASHVGIYTGNGKFIQMGNHGLKEQDLNSKTWTETYKYDGARRVVSGGSGTSSKTSKISSSSAKTSTKSASQSDFDSAVDNAKQKVEDANAKIYQLTIDTIQDIVTESENRIDRFSTLITQSQGKQSRLSDNSAAWRKEESSQSSYLQSQQKEIEDQNKQLDKLVKENKITSGEFDKQKAANSEKWWDYEKQIQEKRFNVISSNLKEYDNKIDMVKAQFDEAGAKMDLLTEGTKEYNIALQNQIPFLRNEQQLHQKKIDLINEQLTSDKLTAAQKEDLIAQLHTETAAWLDNESAIKSNIERLQQLRESAADKIIEDYKSLIEKQQDLELDALDKRKNAEDERHEQAKKNLEDETKAFEEYINAQLKSMDRQNSSDDYETELNKKLKERQELIDKINVLALDNSASGKKRKNELQDQLDAKNEEIDKFKLDRERELRKQGLQDQLDDRKKYSDNLGEIEDQRSKDELDNIDKEKKAIEQKYKDILEDEKRFYEIKKGLLSRDSNVVKFTLAELQLGYDTYFGNLKDHVFKTTQEFENMNYSLQKMLETLHNYGNGDYSSSNEFPSDYNPSSPNNSNSGNSGSSNGKNSNDTPSARLAWSTYLSNKKKAEDIRKQMEKLDKNSAQFKSLENSYNYLSKQNDGYRHQYPFFPDGSWDKLKDKNIFSAETGGMTSSWGKSGKFALLHEKELVLNKSDTSNLLKIIDVTRNIIGQIKNSFSSNNFKPKNNTIGSTDNSIHIDKVEINATDRDTGNSLLDKFEVALNKKMKTRTI